MRTSLDSFVALARGYSAAHPGASVRDFVDWLDLVERHEHGGEEEAGIDASEEVEVHAGVVQILTVHAAKGLEWRDLVAIPEMVSAQFSEKETGKSWTTDPSVFPFPLRADRAHLPRFRPSDFSEKLDAALAYSRFLRTDIPAHENAEARRLAYVAFTRPQEELFLAGYGLAAKEILPSFVEDDAVSLLPRSVFLDDVRKGAGVLPAADVAGPEWPSELTEECPATMPLAEATERTGGPPEPVIDYANADLPLWPADVVRAGPGAGHASGPDGSGGGSGDSGESPVPPERIAMWRRSADLLIREREAASRPAVPERPYVTATDVVHLSEDPAAFLAQWRRPTPQRPSRAARTGTEVHSRIAEFYERPARLDIDSVMAQGEQPVDMDVLTREEEARLLEAFKASRWARMPAIAVEESLSAVIGGRVVRCTIDAVLDTSAEPDLSAATIVDWKTGRRPDGEALASRELQLAIYRLAWARAHGRDIADVGACFVYLREPEGRQTLAAAKLTEEEVARRIEDSLAAGMEAGVGLWRPAGE